jgi:hypothetical protein
LENQHRKITGYRELSQEEIDLMNQIKAKGNELGNLIDSGLFISNSDQRWRAIGKTQVQQGVMALVRSIAKPESF